MLVNDRNSDGLSVEFHYNEHDPEKEFEIRVKDTRTDSDFTLFPETGKQAIFAFDHPFSAANSMLKSGKIAA